jgi:hypothetical protein
MKYIMQNQSLIRSTHVIVVEDALNKTAKQLKSDLEELASYADKAKDNAYAYGEESIEELSATYNHYALLFEDSEIGKMLKDFPGRYYDAMPKVEAAQSVGGAGFNVLTAVLTGGAAAAVVVAGLVLSKAGLFAKAGKTINKILKLLEKKKKTPDAAIKKPHNEVATAEVDKPKKEEVKKKDKEKCKRCSRAYNKNCSLNNPPKSSTGNNERDNKALYKGIKDTRKEAYPKKHPWYAGPYSLEVHHCIDVDSVEEMGKLFKQFNYDINGPHNTAVMPADMKLACHLAVPRHKGEHDAGRAIADDETKDAAKLEALSKLENEKAGTESYGEVIEEEENYLTYIEAVNEELESIAEIKKSGGLCHDRSGKPRSPKEMNEAFESEMKDISQAILTRLDRFLWTLSSDGRDYQEDNPCGCSGADVLTKHKTKKTKVRGEKCPDGRDHDLSQKRYTMKLGH